MRYCKSVNIRGVYVTNDANDANGYANILENVWGLLCFCAAQLLVNVSLYDVKYLCNTKISSEHLLNVNLTTREYVFVLPTRKN